MAVNQHTVAVSKSTTKDASNLFGLLLSDVAVVVRVICIHELELVNANELFSSSWLGKLPSPDVLYLDQDSAIVIQGMISINHSAQ
jgi:hypothetical protein